MYSKASPLPWKVQHEPASISILDSTDYPVTHLNTTLEDDLPNANARYLVQAVNHHEALVEVLHALVYSPNTKSNALRDRARAVLTDIEKGA